MNLVGFENVISEVTDPIYRSQFISHSKPTDSQLH